MEERLFCNQDVRGSIPLAGTISPRVNMNGFTVVRELPNGEITPLWRTLSGMWPSLKNELLTLYPELSDKKQYVEWISPFEHLTNSMVHINIAQEWSAITFESEEAWAFLILRYYRDPADVA